MTLTCNGEGAKIVNNLKNLKNMEKDCLIMPQQVYNPYSKMLERSRD